jgi:predicted site-specific integrase-resolvase
VSLERHYSLREASALTGISRQTLRRWLEIDLGLRFPAITRGSKLMLREQDIQSVLRKHSPCVDWTLLKRGRAA